MWYCPKSMPSLLTPPLFAEMFGIFNKCRNVKKFHGWCYDFKSWTKTCWDKSLRHLFDQVWSTLRNKSFLNHSKRHIFNHTWRETKYFLKFKHRFWSIILPNDGNNTAKPFTLKWREFKNPVILMTKGFVFDLFQHISHHPLPWMIVYSHVFLCLGLHWL